MSFQGTLCGVPYTCARTWARDARKQGWPAMRKVDRWHPACGWRAYDVPMNALSPAYSVEAQPKYPTGWEPGTWHVTEHGTWAQVWAKEPGRIVLAGEDARTWYVSRVRGGVREPEVL